MIDEFLVLSWFPPILGIWELKGEPLSVPGGQGSQGSARKSAQSAFAAGPGLPDMARTHAHRESLPSPLSCTVTPDGDAQSLRMLFTAE